MIDVALIGSAAGTMPASTSGRSSRMNAVAWQPGFAMRLLLRRSLALARRQLGQAEDPARRDAVRGAGVDQAGLRVRDQRRGLARGGIGQAQEGDVGGVQQARALGGVLALVGVDAQHLDVLALRRVLVDAQPGRAFLAIDEHHMLHRARVPLAHRTR